MHILLAGDEVTIARAPKVMLEKNKYAVDMVHNGNDALDNIQTTTYDALVLDIMMPEKDGIEVLKAARGSGNTTQALFLTAKADVADRVAGLDVGADDYLPKPFATSEFLARVRALTRRCGKKAEITVSNPVDGAQPIDTSRLFDRFYRADESHSNTVGGTGIGLSIAKATVEAHGGTISAKQEGGVPIFTVRL